MFRNLMIIVLGIYVASLPGSTSPLELRSDTGLIEGGAAVGDLNKSNAPQIATAPDPKELRGIIALSKEGHWALLGGGWLITDGLLKTLKFPQPLFYPAPLAFFDGRSTLVYAHRTDAGSGGLAIFDLSNGSYREIAALSDEPHVPAPSPDKQRVAFVNARGRLQVMDLESLKILDIAPAWKSTPSWSPDGNSIVFEQNREHDQGWGDSEVAVASLASGSASVSVLDKGRFPSWSPNGDLIAYTDVDGKQLRLIDPHGGNRHVVKSNLAAIRGPLVGPLVWSPDQKKLIFRRIHDDLAGEEHSKVYLVDIDSRDTKQLMSDQVVLGWR
jgi:Tol biopolymer transport system component